MAEHTKNDCGSYSNQYLRKKIVKSFKKKFVKSQHSVSRFCHLTRFFYCFFYHFLTEIVAEPEAVETGNDFGVSSDILMRDIKAFLKTKGAVIQG